MISRRWERFAWAKVNLGLAVTGRRPDGLHEIESVFMRVGLADRLAVTVPEPAITHDVLAVNGDVDCPVEDNLVLHATDALRRASAQDDSVLPPLPGLALVLDKSIPVAAGMGGGSSDAAAALSLAEEAWRTGTAPSTMAGLAVQLGADVPFFVADKPAARVSGIGEAVEELPGVRGGVGILLVTPPATKKTATVYAAYDESARAGNARETVAELVQALRRGLDGRGLVERAAGLAAANDLSTAAMAVTPGLGDARAALIALLGRPVLMTGSGPTLVALYDSAGEAVDAGQQLAAHLPAGLEAARIVAVDDHTPVTRWRHP